MPITILLYIRKKKKERARVFSQSILTVVQRRDSIVSTLFSETYGKQTFLNTLRTQTNYGLIRFSFTLISVIFDCFLNASGGGIFFIRVRVYSGDCSYFLGLQSKSNFHLPRKVMDIMLLHRCYALPVFFYCLCRWWAGDASIDE